VDPPPILPFARADTLGSLTDLLAIIALTTFAGTVHAIPFFTGIGFGPGASMSRAYGVSPDGTTVVGTTGTELDACAAY